MVISPSQERPLTAAGWCLIYPGLGQAMQGRRLAAAWHAVDFSVLVLGGLIYPAAQPMWWGMALAFGLYSVVDAYRHATA